MANKFEMFEAARLEYLRRWGELDRRENALAEQPAGQRRDIDQRILEIDRMELQDDIDALKQVVRQQPELGSVQPPATRQYAMIGGRP